MVNGANAVVGGQARMSDGILGREAPGRQMDRQTGRLADWPRRHRLQIAAALVFTLTCILGMAASSVVFHAVVDAAAIAQLR